MKRGSQWEPLQPDDAPDPSKVADEELVAKARDRDPASMAQLYERYYDRMFRFVYARVGNRPDAEDLTQEVFVKMVDKIGTFRWQGIPFSAWLFRVGHNTITDYMRRKQVRGVTMSVDDLPLISSDDPEEEVARKMSLEAIAANMRRLSPAQQEVLALRFGADLSVLETARTLKKAEGTIKATQFQAFQALRRLMAKEAQ